MNDTPTTDLAAARTDLAEDRTVLANERTFAGWLRTGFAGIGIGLAFNALFNRLDPPWVPRAIGTAFLIVAILIFVVAERRSSAVLNRLHQHQVKSIGRKRMVVITAISVLATVGLIAAMWLLPFGIAPVP